MLLERKATLPDRFRDFFGLEQNVLVMTFAGTLQGVGVGLWSGYLPKVLGEMGARPMAIGGFGTFSGLVGLIFPFLGGKLSDRLGRGRAMILASGLGVGGYLIYLVAPTWWVFFFGTLLTTAGAYFGFMGSLALTGDSLRPQRRAISIGMQNVIGRLGPGLMPPLGGALILWLGLTQGVRVGLGITVLLTLGSIWLQRCYYRFPPIAERTSSVDLRTAWRTMRPALKRVLVADCLIRLGSGMSSAFIVMYVMDVMEGSALDFGFLTMIQALTSVITYIPIAKLADRAGQSSRWPYVAMTYLMFAAFPVALSLIPSVAWLIPVFVVAGLRELGEPARKALIVDLAAGDSRGSVIGAYYTLLGGVVFPASFIGGWLWEQDPRIPLVVGGVVTGLGLLWFLWRGRR